MMCSRQPMIIGNNHMVGGMCRHAHPSELLASCSQHIMPPPDSTDQATSWMTEDYVATR